MSDRLIIESARRWRHEIENGERPVPDELDRRFIAVCDALLAEPQPVRPILTRRERQVLRAIETYTDQYETPPSYAEIGNIIGVRSRAHVGRLAHQLIAKGYLASEPGKMRNLRII
jgi:hypothetical protein